ncbi:hypothetical protein AB7Z98_12135 [Providencia manganoxydans]|uniref:hypothetical protein n=1 Tax=Providencia manganoxydans TaxID=2923283 RepID=UPI0034E50951
MAITWRWENGLRWYEAELCFDLFGDLLLIQRWGGLTNKLHGEKTELIPDYLSGIAHLFAIDKQRKSRKPPYRRIR